MGSTKRVTSAQTESLRTMANAKGISRDAFQVWLDEHAGSTLDSIKRGSVGITAPEGARIHIVRVTYRPDCEWQEAVNAAGPNTPLDYNVRKVGDQYPQNGTKEITENIVLLNYPKGGSWDKAQAWAESVGLKKTEPRSVFAIGKQHPDLHRTLGLDPMYVVVTKDCSFGGLRQACYVWWGGSDRWARLCWVGDFGCCDGWFAFRK